MHTILTHLYIRSHISEEENCTIQIATKILSVNGTGLKLS